MRVPFLSDRQEDKPQFAALWESPESGELIMSMHVIKYEATHNANIFDGKVLPIDWVGNEIILPWRNRIVND